jgi:hypothetical protein
LLNIEIAELDPHSMRPKFILIIMVLTLAFFLILMFSPGFWHRKAVGRAESAWVQNRTPENEQAIQLERYRARHGQYIVCGLAVLNVLVIVVYGGLQHRKRRA